MAALDAADTLFVPVEEVAHAGPGAVPHGSGVSPAPGSAGPQPWLRSENGLFLPGLRAELSRPCFLFYSWFSNPV